MKTDSYLRLTDRIKRIIINIIDLSLFISYCINCFELTNRYLAKINANNEL